MMANALRAEGIKACMAQDYPTAANKFTQAIHLDPDNHLLYSKRSAVYTAQSEYQNALVDADKAVEIKPRCVKGWLFKGAALHGLKDLAAARDAYEEALKIDPGNQHAQYGKKVVQETIDRKVDEKVEVENAEKSVKDEGLSEAEKGRVESKNPTTDMEVEHSNVISVSFARIGTPKFIFGHDVEFPRGPADLLEAWHLVYPSCIPPCSYTVGGPPRQHWKVFDRDGNVLKYTIFHISSETAPSYRVFVLHDLAGADRLVSCVDLARQRTFLLAWNGVEMEFDSKVSAVRVVGRSYDGISFHKSMFRTEPKNPRPRASGLRRSSMPMQSSAPSRTRSLRTRRKVHTIKAIPSKEAPSSKDESSETSSSESEVSEYQASPRPKKPRISSAPSGPIQTHKIEDVVFKLISEQSDDTRCFPMVECSNGKMLFVKSRKFFRLINPDAEVNILSCRLPFQHERRYLFEGSEGEFSLLLADIQNLKGSQKNPVIEVKCIT